MQPEFMTIPTDWSALPGDTRRLLKDELLFYRYCVTRAHYVQRPLPRDLPNSAEFARVWDALMAAGEYAGYDYDELRNALIMRMLIGGLYVWNGKPYFKVWPDYVVPFVETSLDVPCEEFRPPFSSFAINLPVGTHMANGVTRFSGMQLGWVGPPVLPESCPGLFRESYNGACGRFLENGTTGLLQMQAYTTDGKSSAIIIKCQPGTTIETQLAITLDSRATRCKTPAGFPTDAELIGLLRISLAVCYLSSGRDRIVEPDVLAKDMPRYLVADTDEKIERLHERATNRRGAKGYTVGRCERLLVQPQRPTGPGEETGRELSHQHQRRAHFHRFKTNEGHVTKWIRQLTVRPDLPPLSRADGRGYLVK